MKRQLPRRELSGIFRWFRRKYYYKFKPEYVKESLANKKGYCKNCGCCTTKLIPCKYFDKEEGDCILWREKGREATFQNCKDYPFDEKDKTNWAKKNCGFYWD